jgi:hypothetical protein
MSESNVSIEIIERRIFLVRGRKVMLDFHLAELYKVTTGNLNLAVRRNKNRFPQDFMFQLKKEETNSLLLQIAIAKTGRGGRQTSPYVFTEQGVAMLSSVLRSERAIQVNIAIMRAFVKLRELFAGNRRLAEKLREMEKKYDAQFKEVFEVIEAMLPKPELENKLPFGFGAPKKGKGV